MTYAIEHIPLSSREPYVVKDGLELDEAKAELKARAERMEKKYLGCEITWTGDMSYELIDDTAAMVGDYQGRTRIVEEGGGDDE